MAPRKFLVELVRREARFFRDVDPSSYRITGFLFLRALGFIYAVAFLALANQLGGLLSSDGLLPAHLYLERVEGVAGVGWQSYSSLPTLMWIDCSDATLTFLCFLGLVAALVLLAGYSSAWLLFVLWALYLSFYQVGQIFFGYGWEILLLETGFLAVFMAPLRAHALFSPAGPPRAVIWLLRWVLFRVMFGAGLIKLRGDQCWLELTCMVFHYETQPLPNPISWYLHQLPSSVHVMGGVLTHFVELVVPWFVFGPMRLRRLAGLILVVFQGLLIVSGNLAWFNWLTIVICIVCFDDQLIMRLLPAGWQRDVAFVVEDGMGLVRQATVYGLTVMIIMLSIDPIRNMVSPRQAMNRSFDSLHLVNSYGAFGHVGRERYEIVLQGTYEDVLDAATQWQEYEFKCKPGSVDRRPCMVAPYHLRLDWQIWFAAMSDYTRQPWLVHLVYKLLQGDQVALGLMADTRFKDKPPRYLRAELYRYEFTGFERDGAWWRRSWQRSYLPPLSLQNEALLRVVDSFGWPRFDPTREPGL